MDDIAGQITRARSVLGWTQAELARRVGVGQQAVSGWESGRSTPGETTLRKLRAVLGLDRGDDGRPPSVDVPRLLELPFSMLNEYQFETFSADLVSELYPGATINQFGTRGEEQYGIDLTVQTVEGERFGVQCKHIQKFQPSSLKQAVGKFDPFKAGVARCVLVSTARATVKVQELLRQFPAWEIWDSDTLARKVHGLPADAALRIVDRYFPGLRGPFLGIERPNPWETAEQAFDRFGPGDRFSHRWSLVGREPELEALLDFATASSNEPQIGLVLGAAGGGKSRLMKALAERLEDEPSTAVRLAPRQPVRPEDFTLLPNESRLVLIIDDAHEQENDLRALITGAARERPNLKIVLAMRPYGMPIIRSALRQLGIDVTSLPTWPLGSLTVPQAVEIATEALGPTMGHVSLRLAQTFRDSPLLLLAAAVQVRTGQLSTKLIETDTQIREIVTDAFLRSAVTNGISANPIAHQVLRAVALLQPFRENVPAFQQAIAELTEQRFHNLTPHLKALEEEGILLRRGAALRIVPDLLGDVVLAQAALTSTSFVSASSTGYLEHAYTVIPDGEPLLNTLINASRIDWQWHQENVCTSSLIEPLWQVIAEKFKSSRSEEQAAMLPILRRIGAFQPGPVFELMTWLLKSTTLDEVPAKVASVLEAVSYSLSHIKQACDLLWMLGQGDVRQLHSTPEHPLRVLLDLASYRPGKSTVYHESIIQSVRKWVASAQSQSVHPKMPLGLLVPIFETYAEWTAWEGRSLSIRRTRVSPEKVRNLRSEALEVIFAEYGSTDPRRSAISIEVIGDILRKTGRDDESQTIQTLTELAREVRATPPGGLASLAIQRAVHWSLTHGRSEVQVAAQEVVNALPKSIECDIATVLYSAWWSWGRPGEETPVQDARAAAWEDKIRDVATEVASWVLEKAFNEIQQLLNNGREIFEVTHEHAHTFLTYLMEAQPALPEYVCDVIPEASELVQQTVLPAALGALLRHTSSLGISKARELISRNQVSLTRAVAATLTERVRNLEIPADSIIGIAGELARHDDQIVRCYIIRAAWSLSQTDKNAAIDLALAVPLRGSLVVAKEFANAITIFRWISWEDLNRGQLDAVLAQLCTIPRIDDYELQRLLASLTASNGEEVLRILMARVDLAIELDSSIAFEPLPYYWDIELGLAKLPNRIEFLRSIHSWIAESIFESEIYHYRREFGPRLFKEIVGEFDSSVRELFLAWFEFGSERDRDAASYLLRAASANIVFQDVSFICEVLRSAARTSDRLVQLVGISLRSGLTDDVRSGPIGEPHSEDLAIRDQAAAVIQGLASGSVEERFYRSLKEWAERMIGWASDDDDLADHRDW